MNTELRKLTELFYKTLSFAPPGLRPELSCLARTSILKLADGNYREVYMHFLTFKDGVEMIMFNFNWNSFEFELRKPDEKGDISFRQKLREQVYCNLASIIDSVGTKIEGVQSCELDISRV